MRRGAVLLAAALVASAAAAIEPVSGVARTRDASTVAIGGVRVRLAGVLPPGPERRCDGAASCAEAAETLLAGELEGHTVRCTRERRLGHGYYLGRCALEDGTDPALRLLEAGLAEPEAPPTAAYEQAAAAARAAGRGLYAE